MNYRMLCLCSLTAITMLTSPMRAQDPPAVAIVIADEPKAVDPAIAVPQRLAANATIRFEDTALVDVAKWIQQQTGMNVSMDRQSLNAAQILPSEPVHDELKDSPVYLLLDRLRVIGVTWHLKNNQIHLTSVQDVSHLSPDYSY